MYQSFGVYEKSVQTEPNVQTAHTELASLQVLQRPLFVFSLMNKQEVDEFSGKIFGIDLTQQTTSTRLAICVGGTFAFYLIYGYLQVCNIYQSYYPSSIHLHNHFIINAGKK